jgi:hypothetical protein
VWNAGWEKSPGSQPPTCSAMAIRSESKSLVPLTVQNAGGSNTNLLDLKTGAGAVTTSFNSAGQLSKMNGVAAVGNGAGVEVYSTVSEAARTSLPAITMLAPAADGTFAAYFYVTQVDAGVSCTAAAQVSVNLIYSDPFSGAAQPLKFMVPLLGSGGQSASAFLRLSTDKVSAANVAAGSMVFRARGGTTIDYSTTYTPGACATQPTYRIAPVLLWF